MSKGSPSQRDLVNYLRVVFQSDNFAIRMKTIFYIELFRAEMNRSEEAVKPMPLCQSILIGVIIAGVAMICFYYLRPLLEKAGFREYAAYLISLSLGLIVMLIWAVLSYLSGENNRALKDFLIRVRLDHLKSKWLYWALALGVIMFLSTVIFSPILSWLISHNIIPLPHDIPDYINPIKQLSIAKVK